MVSSTSDATATSQGFSLDEGTNDVFIDIGGKGFVGVRVTEAETALKGWEVLLPAEQFHAAIDHLQALVKAENLAVEQEISKPASLRSREQETLEAEGLLTQRHSFVFPDGTTCVLLCLNTKAWYEITQKCEQEDGKMRFPHGLVGNGESFTQGWFSENLDLEGVSPTKREEPFPIIDLEPGPQSQAAGWLMRSFRCASPQNAALVYRIFEQTDRHYPEEALDVRSKIQANQWEMLGRQLVDALSLNSEFRLRFVEHCQQLRGRDHVMVAALAKVPGMAELLAPALQRPTRSQTTRSSSTEVHVL